MQDLGMAHPPHGHLSVAQRRSAATDANCLHHARPHHPPRAHRILFFGRPPTCPLFFTPSPSSHPPIPHRAASTSTKHREDRNQAMADLGLGKVRHIHASTCIRPHPRPPPQNNASIGGEGPDPHRADRGAQPHPWPGAGRRPGTPRGQPRDGGTGGGTAGGRHRVQNDQGREDCGAGDFAGGAAGHGQDGHCHGAGPGAGGRHAVHHHCGFGDFFLGDEQDRGLDAGACCV